MNKVDPNGRYVYFYRGGRDPWEHLSVVPVELFDKIKPHEGRLDAGHVVPEVQAEVDTALGMPNLAPSFSDRDFDRIPAEHFARVCVC